MSTAVLASRPKKKRIYKPLEPRQIIVLNDIDWAGYRRISESLNESHARLTYDQGVLEIMTKSRLHEILSRFCYTLFFILAEEAELDFTACGSMTCDREDLDRAAEPDECIYIVNSDLMQGRKTVDLSIDPPPDLMVEIDITSSSKRRLGIFAALKVPEVWKVTLNSFQVLQLDEDGQYVESECSKYFPGIPMAKVAEFVKRQAEEVHRTLFREFRTWVRKQLRRSKKKR
ncbi:MAG TPA: Uma2 family endonuclease [Gemmataceae bacterium]|nr:Uma2 family endonuclease [Gemmataceae bacterium]